jgi:hypothetical protein
MSSRSKHGGYKKWIPKKQRRDDSTIKEERMKTSNVLVVKKTIEGCHRIITSKDD